jgi:hypothetical protein
MDWLDQKYINLVSNRLRNFKRKTGSLYNCSCPLCGDSEYDTRKARGYLYEVKGKTLYHCHNCNVTNDFPKFLKQLDLNLHSEYILDKLKDRGKRPTNPELDEFVKKLKKPVFLKDGPLKGLKKVSQLSPDHYCKKYVESRKIPNSYHAKLFYCPKFFSWVNDIIPGKFSAESLANDHGRLLIPFINKDDKMHAFQGRALDSTAAMRYITIVNDESVPKIYGLDTVDVTKKIYVTEGVLDCIFLPNAVATAGGDIVSGIKELNKKNVVILYDNEPRSKHTVDKIQKAIYNGYKVCIWPENFVYKDINESIIAGLSSEFVKYIIDTNTYHDLAAMVHLTKWKKI